jgi:hypothetical protein
MTRATCLLVVAAAAAGCGSKSLVFSDSLAEWCDDAPCGWRLESGAVARAPDGARLGGPVASSLTRAEPVTLDFAPDDPYPGNLVVLSTGYTLLEVRWSDGTDDQLLLDFTEPTYLYLMLDPPRTADRFGVTLTTAAGQSSLLTLVGVTRCAPFSGANRHVGINSALEGDRVLFWHYVEERYFDGFGDECPHGGGGGGDDTGAVGGE